MQCYRQIHKNKIFWLMANSLLWHPIQFWIEQGCAENKHLINCCCSNFRNLKKIRIFALEICLQCGYVARCLTHTHNIIYIYNFWSFRVQEAQSVLLLQTKCNVRKKWRMGRESERNRLSISSVCLWYVGQSCLKITPANILFDTHKISQSR